MYKFQSYWTVAEGAGDSVSTWKGDVAEGAGTQYLHEKEMWLRGWGTQYLHKKEMWLRGRGTQYLHEKEMWLRGRGLGTYIKRRCGWGGGGLSTYIKRRCTDDNENKPNIIDLPLTIRTDLITKLNNCWSHLCQKLDLIFIKGLSIEASYPVLVHSAKQFQRGRILEISQPETRISYDGQVY